MVTLHTMKARRAIKGECDIDNNTAWIDFELDESNVLRLVVPEDHLARLKLAVQQLQGVSSDQRRERGWPVLTKAHTAKVMKVEFGSDDNHQVAVIRTRFDHGASQDTVLEMDHIRMTIEFLTRTLERFESQGPPKGH